MSNVTVGIDIGTSSVKAIAADDDGTVVARARIPHDFSVPSPQRFQHDAKVAWHAGPQGSRGALGEVIGHPGCVLEGGTIDAFAEQLVADAGAEGDVLVILGTTLIVWAVVPDAVEIPNYYAMPNTAGGTFLLGGPSNAGGLFLN